MNVKDLFYEDIEVEDLFNDGDRDDPDYVPTTKKKMPREKNANNRMKDLQS